MNALTNHAGKNTRVQAQKKITRLIVVCTSILLAQARVLLAQAKMNCEKTESPNENSVLDLAHARAFLACARPPPRLFNSTLAPSRFFIPGPASINHVQKHAFQFC